MTTREIQTTLLPQKRAHLLLLAFAVLMITRTSDAQRRVAIPIGLRDQIGIGLSAGTSTGFRADVRLVRLSAATLGVEAMYGAGIAWWGIGEAWGIGARMDLNLTDDGMNNALVLAPSIGFAQMFGSSGSRLWIDFTPHRTVSSVFASASFAWVHEYRSNWSLELSLQPGLAVGLNGEASNHDDPTGRTSLLMNVTIGIRF